MTDLVSKAIALQEEKEILVSEMNDTARWMHADGIEGRVAEIDAELNKINEQYEIEELSLMNNY